jgi:SPP1 gp7 family putative phage head morphogenesis protein
MSPPETIQEIIQRYRQALEQRETEAVIRLTDSYQRIYDQLSTEQDALLQQIAALRAQGKPITKPMIHRLQRYQKLIGDIEREVQGYGAIIADEMRAQVPDAAQLGVDFAAEMVQASLTGFPQEVAQGIIATFDRMPSEAVESLVGAMLEDSPLFDETLMSLGEDTARGVGDALVRGLLSGKGPRDVARAMTDQWGVPLTRAMTIARTEQLRAHRMASLASYRQNAHIVKGWVWHAELDGLVCLSCVALHGSRHGLDETLDDHPSGRCAMLPITPSWADLGFTDMPETGVDSWLQEGEGERWFNDLPEEQQQAMMGPGKFAAWQDGAFQFNQLSKATTHPRWGRTFVETPLKELVGIVAQAKEGPVTSALLEDGKYHWDDLEDRSRRTVGDLRTRNNDITAAEFDAEAEARRIKQTTARYREVLANDGEFVRYMDREGWRMTQYAGDGDISIQVIFTGDQKDAGMGTGGPGSTRVFYAPYGLADRAARLPWETFQTDPLYVLTHELHHAFGSGSEFDIISDVIGLDVHLAAGNSLNTTLVDRAMDSLVLQSFHRASGRFAESTARAKGGALWLSERHPEAIGQVLAQYGVDLKTQQGKWRSAWNRYVQKEKAKEEAEPWRRG